MANQRIVDYIKTQLPRGFALEQIKRGLVSQGWAKKEVEEAARVVTQNAKESEEKNENLDLRKNGRKRVPALVKIIAVLYFISICFLLGLGSLFILGFGSIGSLTGSLSAISILSAIGTIIAIPCFAFAVLFFFIGRGLWKGQKWARIIAIIFALLGLLGGISALLWSIYSPISMSSSITWLLFNGAVAGYLLFSKKTREAFA